MSAEQIHALYDKTLEAFRTFGPDDRRTDYALEQAVCADTMTAGFLTAEQHPTLRRYQNGDPPEKKRAALAYASGEAADKWRQAEGALEWLAEQAIPALERANHLATLYCFRTPYSESPPLAAYKAVLEALLHYYGEERSLLTKRLSILEVYTYFSVLGYAYDVAAMAEELLEDGVSDFEVRVRSEEDAEVFRYIGLEPAVQRTRSN